MGAAAVAAVIVVGVVVEQSVVGVEVEIFGEERRERVRGNSIHMGE